MPETTEFTPERVAEIVELVEQIRFALIEASTPPSFNGLFPHPSEVFPEARLGLSSSFPCSLNGYVSFGESAQEQRQEDPPITKRPAGAELLMSKPDRQWTPAKVGETIELSPQFTPTQLAYLRTITPDTVLADLREMLPSGSKWTTLIENS